MTELGAEVSHIPLKDPKVLEAFYKVLSDGATSLLGKATEMETSNGKLQESPTEDDVETIQIDGEPEPMEVDDTPTLLKEPKLDQEKYPVLFEAFSKSISEWKYQAGLRELPALHKNTRQEGHSKRGITYKQKNDRNAHLAPILQIESDR